MKGKKIIFRILRYKPSVIDPPRFQDFEMSVTDTMSVLECLEEIRKEQDSTLIYRKSCHHASCGTCACIINGKERLACITKVADLDNHIVTLEPLRGFRCEGDLAVSEDWSPLRNVDRGKATDGRDDQKSATRFEDCIECGACLSACPAAHGGNTFMGPAALAAIHNEIEKSPDKRESLLSLAGGPDGEKWCERALDCSRVCPSGVYPARHIAELRKLLGR